MSRKLDAAIAKALGKQVDVMRYTSTKGEMVEVYGIWNDILPAYSTDGNAMLELDSAMRKKCCKRFMFADSDLFTITYIGAYTSIGSCFVRSSKATAETMPKAVALAAYKALTGKEWEE